jgi:RHS repeat-associated protein
LTDHLGSIRRVSAASGAPQLSREYDPWGRLVEGASPPGYAFTGREWDAAIGLYYFRARYYSPAAARFLSEDPIGLAGGSNSYRYVNNGPASGVDPTGHYRIAAGSSVFHAKVREATDIIAADAAGCAPCIAWFIGHNSDIVRMVSPGRPPLIVADYTTRWTGWGGLAGWSAVNPDRVFLVNAMVEKETPCFIAGVIVHEFIHLAQYQVSFGHNPRRLGASRHDADFVAGVGQCSVGRIVNVPF